VIYILNLHPLTNPEPATLDMRDRMLYFPGTKNVLKCPKCAGFITSSEKFLKEHYHLVHQGINLSFSLTSPHVPILRELVFTEKIK
jgi:hypothetical protein